MAHTIVELNDRSFRSNDVFLLAFVACCAHVARTDGAEVWIREMTEAWLQLERRCAPGVLDLELDLRVTDSRREGSFAGFLRRVDVWLDGRPKSEVLEVMNSFEADFGLRFGRVPTEELKRLVGEMLSLVDSPHPAY